MRCRFCGSKSLHEDTQRKNFSTGKAAAGAVVFGVVGAAAGFIGKDQKGYRCGACGQFMDAPMDFFTEGQVDTAIRDAESGRRRTMFDYYHNQYANIQANIPAALPTSASAPAPEIIYQPMIAAPMGTTLKRSYRYGLWEPDCPIWVEGVILKTAEDGDRLSLAAWNLGKETVRSVYFLVKVFDDTGDQVSECRCVYQGLSIPRGGQLPEEKEFPLNTDLAYRVELTCEKAALEGDAVWRQESKAKEHSLPEQPELSEENFPRLIYANPKYSALKTDREHYKMPIQAGNFWMCCCGAPVQDGQQCPRCGDTWEHVELCFSQPYLMERQQKAVRERAAKRATELDTRLQQVKQERQKQEEAAKNAVYAEAQKLQSQGKPADLRAAAAKYSEISSWRDADKQAKVCLAQANDIEERERAEAAARRERETQEAAERKRKTKKIALIIIACIVFVIFLTSVIIPKQKYNAAVAKYGQEYVDSFYALNVGDTFIFGSYEQDNNKANGKEDVEWLVLAKKGDRILVISKYALDYQPYNTEKDFSQWQISTLREWLNSDFLHAAFSAEEMVMIPTVTVSADRNPDHPAYPGNDTQDQVFLLSITELNEYLKTDDERMCAPTAYAIAQGADTRDSDRVDGKKAACEWLLRSPGYAITRAARVTYDGSVDSYGKHVSFGGTVRPALWIELGS